MAKSISDEELQLRKRARRRLVGAIALVTVVAVFLPMVLDHEPKPVSQDVNIKIPSPDAGVFTSKIVPVAPGKSAPAKSESPAVPPATPEPAKAEAPRVAAAPAPSPVAEQTPPAYDTEAAPPKKAASAKAATPPKAAEKPAPAPDKPKSSDKAKENGSYVVQVAALNDPDKARQMRDQIAGSGLKAYTEVVPTAKGNVTRVRAGPFTSKPDAEKARDKLKALGLAGNVVPK